MHPRPLRRRAPALLLLLLCLTVPLSAQGPRIPETPAGRALGRLLSAIAAGDAASREALVAGYSPALLQRVPRAQHLEALETLSAEIGAADVVSVDESTDAAVAARIRGRRSGETVRVRIGVDAAPPHAVSSLRVEEAGPPASSPAVPPKPADDAAIARRAGERMRSLEALGFSGTVLVARGGRTVFEGAYGMADRAAGRANTSETAFNIGSLAKQFTAAAILKLEEEGKLRTTDSIGRFFPDAPAEKRGITIHDLLTHTSGLRGNPGAPRQTERDPALRAILAAPMDARPGERMIYSNSGYVLLGMIVEQASGKDLDAYLGERILGPAGLTGTSYRGVEGVPTAGLYVGDDATASALERGYPDYGRVGAGGILSTTGDLLRWQRALQTDAVLSAASRRKLFTPFLDDYAYGWGIRTGPYGRTIGHNGGNTLGTGADLRWWPEHDLVMVVLANDDGENRALGRGGALRQLQSIVFGEELAALPSVATASPAVLATRAGTYLLPGGARVTVTADGGRLRMAGEGQAAVAAVSTGRAPSAEQASGATERVQALLAAVARGDSAAVRAMGGPPRLLESVLTLPGRLAAEMGAYRGHEVVGAVGDNPGDSPTVRVRMRFERGSRLLGIVVTPRGELMMVRQYRSEPATAFLPLTPAGDEVGAMDWGRGTVRRARFGADGTLRIETPDGEVVARRG